MNPLNDVYKGKVNKATRWGNDAIPGGSYKAPEVLAGPQYSPAGGIGTRDGDYTWTGDTGGWLRTNTNPAIAQPPAQPPAQQFSPPPAQPPAQPPARNKYKNPKTGEYYTVQEYANSVAMKIPVSQGDVPGAAMDSYTNPNASVDELNTRANNLNNARNDIASGATDPYKAGADSGIAYSPQELKAIESAYAGVYDPALNDVFTRLRDKQATDKEALTRKNMLEEKAIEHQYRMDEKDTTATGLVGPSSYQEWSLAGGEEGTGQTYADFLNGPQEENKPSYKSEVATQGKKTVASMLEIAINNPEIFGRIATEDAPIKDWMRSDAHRNYKALIDTLSGNIIPAALTAMREASATGGAVGQVSDREGTWLASSLGAVAMTQDPVQVVEQLKQINASLTRWQEAVDKYSGGQNTPETMILLNGDVVTLQPDGSYE